jgi:hypothetical protein
MKISEDGRTFIIVLNSADLWLFDTEMGWAGRATELSLGKYNVKNALKNMGLRFNLVIISVLIFNPNAIIQKLLPSRR